MKKILLCTTFIFCMLLIPMSILTSCSKIPTLYKYADTAMGTVMQLNLYTVQEAAADSFAEESMDMLRRLEQEQLSWRLETSEIYRLNAVAGTNREMVLSPELAQIMSRSLNMWEQSNGAFDVALGAVARLWRIDAWAAGESSGENFQIPTPAEIETALQICGSDKIHATSDDAGMSLTLPAGLQLDLGAVGKGIALDQIRALLVEQPDISGAVISAGGSILVHGTKPDNSNWKVGIINPLDPSATIGNLTLDGSGWFVTTSGDYERYVEVDGVRYHHILDPATGYPAQSQVRGVTLLTGDGMLGDMLSTACFVLGVEEGLALAAEYGAEILFVLSDGNIVMSDGMKQYFNATK